MLHYYQVSLEGNYSQVLHVSQVSLLSDRVGECVGRGEGKGDRGRERKVVIMQDVSIYQVHEIVTSCSQERWPSVNCCYLQSFYLFEINVWYSKRAKEAISEEWIRL